MVLDVAGFGLGFGLYGAPSTAPLPRVDRNRCTARHPADGGHLGGLDELLLRLALAPQALLQLG